MTARRVSTSSMRAKLGLKKTSMKKGDMGGVRGPGTGGRMSHPTAHKKNIKKTVNCGTCGYNYLEGNFAAHSKLPKHKTKYHPTFKPTN